ncbi:hypothetical protein METHB2_530011 [Candidatus Methylobacter favarea]|uniref:Uncharacterized protein n=1 Tax=Candidatus Methylobacter favarea TaxID=2707345 RepID=A0A8S0X976_9GAMM|nr:hypothetical protein METHB2_530011 [Candidatus Methylobacter favarea]
MPHPALVNTFSQFRDHFHQLQRKSSIVSIDDNAKGANVEDGAFAYCEKIEYKPYACLVLVVIILRHRGRHYAFWAFGRMQVHES